ncbi:Hypothetical_protein [Hexamita inflata]|uniref:Hypothetical_protein n=1 Tax=Hexamita inflata TaxID=28002 RepID=A0ABP1HQC2_9EUKA
MLEIGTFKLLLSVGLWLVGKYTNSGNAQFSYMLYYYKYCIDIIGAAFYLIILMKLRLRKRNQVEQMLDKPQLVLQSMQTIEPNISAENQTPKQNRKNSLVETQMHRKTQFIFNKFISHSTCHSQVNEDNKE